MFLSPSIILMQISTLCTVCNKGELISDLESGEVICEQCGLVVSDRAIERRAEWRGFNSDESSRSRIGTPSSLAKHDMGLATVIGKTNRDANGNLMNAATLSTLDRLRTWDYRGQARSSADKNMIQAFSQLDRLKDKLALSDAVFEKTAYVYRKALERDLAKGRSISSLVGACIYIASRELDALVTLKDITRASNIEHRRLTKMYRFIVMELDLKIPRIDHVKCITRVANRAGASEKTKREAIGLMYNLERADKKDGKSPMGLAAMVVYSASAKNKERITQKDIATAADISDVTLRNRLKDLKPSSPTRYALT